MRTSLPQRSAWASRSNLQRRFGDAGERACIETGEMLRIVEQSEKIARETGTDSPPARAVADAGAGFSRL